MDQLLRNQFSIEKKRRTTSHQQPSYHFHTYFEFYYMLEGECRFFIYDRIYYVQKGDLLIVAPNDHHLTIYDKGGFHDRFLIRFPITNVEPSILEHEDLCNKLLASSYQFTISEDFRPALENTLSSMLSDFLNYSVENDMKLHFQFQEVLISIYQHLVINEEQLPLSLRSSASSCQKSLSSSDFAIETATKYIVQHYSESLSLNDVAKLAGLTPTYFSKKFKVITGLGFKDYLNHIRLKKACELLLETNDTISTISNKCGFSSSNYFGDVFCSSFGLSPRDYRKKNY